MKNLKNTLRGIKSYSGETIKSSMIRTAILLSLIVILAPIGVVLLIVRGVAFQAIIFGTWLTVEAILLSIVLFNLNSERISVKSIDTTSVHGYDDDNLTLD
jgi:hypothetical protein